MHNPFLIGKTLYLRTIDVSDVNARYQQWFNDVEVCRYNSHHRFPMHAEDMRSYFETVIKSQRNLVLAIIDTKTEKHIGNISLQDIDQVNRSAEFAILIGEKAFWGRGVGTEAARLIIAHGFEALNLHRIYCGTATDNNGMRKVAERLGFKVEGTSRQAVFIDGHYQDILQYGLLSDEFNEKS